MEPARWEAISQNKSLVRDPEERSGLNASSSSSHPQSLSSLAILILSSQVLFCLFILTSNLAVILAFAFKRSLFHSIGKYLFILACVDLCTGFTVIFQTLFFFYPSLMENKWACLLRFQSVVCLTFLSQVTLLLISFERLLSIVHVEGFKHYKACKMWVWILSGLWGYVFAIFLCPLLGWNNWDGETSCVFQLVMRREQMLWTATTSLLTTVAMVIFYAYIWSVVKRKLLQVSVISPAHALSGTGSSSPVGNLNEMGSLTGNLRTTKVAVVVTLAFSLCWVPYSLVELLDSQYPWDPTRSAVGDLLVFPGISNSFVNPIIYICMKKEFRTAFRLICRRRTA